MNVTLRGEPIANSPFRIEVRPGGRWFARAWLWSCDVLVLLIFALTLTPRTHHAHLHHLRSLCISVSLCLDLSIHLCHCWMTGKRGSSLHSVQARNQALLDKLSAQEEELLLLRKRLKDSEERLAQVCTKVLFSDGNMYSLLRSYSPSAYTRTYTQIHTTTKTTTTKKTHTHAYTHAHTHTHTHFFLYPTLRVGGWSCGNDSVECKAVGGVGDSKRH
jgi:hypothetical protein